MAHLRAATDTRICGHVHIRFADNWQMGPTDCALVSLGVTEKSPGKVKLLNFTAIRPERQPLAPASFDRVGNARCSRCGTAYEVYASHLDMLAQRDLQQQASARIAMFEAAMSAIPPINHKEDVHPWTVNLP